MPGPVELFTQQMSASKSRPSFLFKSRVSQPSINAGQDQNGRDKDSGSWSRTSSELGKDPSMTIRRVNSLLLQGMSIENAGTEQSGLIQLEQREALAAAAAAAAATGPPSSTSPLRSERSVTSSEPPEHSSARFDETWQDACAALEEFVRQQRIEERCASTRADEQIAALKSLREETKKNDACRGPLARSPLVSLVVQLLESPNMQVVEEALVVILNTSIAEQSRKALPRLPKLLPSLIKHAAEGSDSIRELTASVLFSLSLADCNKLAIAEAGGVKPLVEVLKCGTKQAKNDSCKALFNLSMLAGNKVQLVEAGAVSPLLDLCEDAGSSLAEKAAAVLSNLSSCLQGRTAIGDHEIGIQRLVEVLEMGTAKANESAAAALWQLASNSSNHRLVIQMEGVIPPLVRLSHLGTPRGRKKAELLLTNLRA